MPHQRKYVLHSSGIEDRPSRAKARISSIASQGFFSRLRRSARCAFVSFVAEISAIMSPWNLGNKKPASAWAESAGVMGVRLRLEAHPQVRRDAQQQAHIVTEVGQNAIPSC